MTINYGFGAIAHSASVSGPAKSKDTSERFVNPVTLTDNSGSFVGTSSSPLTVTGSLGNVILSASDIQIGAVEIKDGLTDIRTTVETGGFLKVSSSGDVPSANAEYAYSTYNSIVYESGSLVKASAGVLYAIHGYSSYTGSQFIQVHNTIAEPADGAVPTVVKIVSATSNINFDFGRFGIPFDTGITIMTSTTGPTMTSGSQNCWFNISYK